MLISNPSHGIKKDKNGINFKIEQFKFKLGQTTFGFPLV